MVRKVARIGGALACALGISAIGAWAQSSPMTAELKPGITAKVIGLKRVPGQELVQLDYEITNGGGTAVNVAELGIGRVGYGLNEILLLDFPHEVSFRVGVADQCLCTQPPEKPLGPGETMKAWAWFQPPATSPARSPYGSVRPIR